MAVTWDWNYKMGEIKGKNRLGNEFTANIYEGNCPLVAVYEYKEDEQDMYSMYLFFVDEAHAKNCLGLTKGKSNIFDDITKIRLNKEKRDLEKIVKWFTRAFDNITIELYTEEKGEE